jgi:hypothetical protein
VPEAETRLTRDFYLGDWVLLRDAVLLVISLVGGKRELGLALINQWVHRGLLDLALLAPDGSTMTLFSKKDCERRTIHAPLNPAEGVRVEPYEAGQHFVRRSDLAKLTSPAADRQLCAEGEAEPAARAKESMPEPAPAVEPELAPPAELRVEPVPPPEPAPAADMGDQAGAVTAATETAESPPKKRLGTTGRPPEKRDAAAERMRADLRKRRLTPDDLRNMKQEALAKKYDCGREAACKARDDVLSEMSEIEFPTNTDTK